MLSESQRLSRLTAQNVMALRFSEACARLDRFSLSNDKETHTSIAIPSTKGANRSDES